MAAALRAVSTSVSFTRLAGFNCTGLGCFLSPVSGSRHFQGPSASVTQSRLTTHSSSSSFQSITFPFRSLYWADFVRPRILTLSPMLKVSRRVRVPRRLRDGFVVFLADLPLRFARRLLLWAVRWPDFEDLCRIRRRLGFSRLSEL